MSYVLLLYTLNKYQKDEICKAIGPFDTEDEAMCRPEVNEHATYTGALFGAATIRLTSPEEAR